MMKLAMKSNLSLTGRTKLFLSVADSSPVKPRTVFYHAYRTCIMSCSPYAIFKRLISDERYEDYEHVWVYGSEDALEYDTFKRYADHPRVRYVQLGSAEHVEALATSEYLITNAGLPSYWQKRDGQVVINTWHGTPLKTLGKDAKDFSGPSIGNAQRNFLLADYLVMPNRYTAEKILDSYDLRGMFKGKVLDMGAPRVDLVLKGDGSRARGLLEAKLGASLEGKKVVLYAPTFRSEGGKSVNTTEIMARHMSSLVECLPDNYEVFFKVHNTMGDFFVGDAIMENRLIFDEIETNELLGAVDVLITDYSSIFFDFICTGKPVLFFVYDKDEYLSDRGMYLDMEDLPGVECKTIDDIVAQVRLMEEGGFSNPNAEFARKTFAEHDDGGATDRVVDVVFGGAACEQPAWVESGNDACDDDAVNVLISLSNKLRMSAAQALYLLLKSLDPKKHRIVIAAHDVHLIWREVEEINPQAHIIFAKIARCKRRWSSADDDAFYGEQFEKYFPGMQFDQYYNLKPGEGFIDEVISHKFPDIEKHWHFSWAGNLDERAVGKLVQHYEEVLVYCPKEEELPDSLHDGEVQVITPREIRDDNRHDFTALFIATLDSTNYALAACAKEFVARGHNAIVVTANPADMVNNRVFVEAGLNVVPLQSMDTGAMNFVDIAIGSPIKPVNYNRLYRLISRHNVLLLSFASLFSSVAMRINPDFLLTLGESKIRELEAYNLRYNCIAMGSPQYDSLLEHRREGSQGPIKSVLIAEQGGYPYGETGKRQLADTLMRIARDNPGIEFAVKPRYLPDGGGKTFHNVSEHLFDFLGDAPANLRLLTTHETLEDLIVGYDAFITMWSTAYLDALVLNMPLLLIGGFESVDVFDVRSQRVAEAYDRLRETGCLYHYSELQGDISDKFRLVDEAYAKDEVYSLGSPCAPRVVNFMEHVYDSLVVPGLRVAGDFTCTEDEFYRAANSIEFVDANSDAYEVKRRYRAMVNTQLQEIVYQNRCMGNVLDLTPLEQLYDLDLSGVSPDSLADFNADMRLMIAECFLDIRTAFFESAQGRDAVERDPILQDFYFDWLYDAGRYAEIENPVVEHLLVPESREYNLACIALNRHRIKKAYDHFFEFLRISESRDIVRLLKCKRMRLMAKPFRQGVMKPLYFRRLLLEKNRWAVDYLYAEVDRNPLLAYNEARRLRRDKNYGDCIVLCDQAQLHYSAKGKKASSVPKTAKLYVKKLFYYLLRQEREKACAAIEGSSSTDER